MKNKVKAIFYIFLLLSNFTVYAAVDIYGYFENRFYLAINPGQNGDNFFDKVSLGDYNRIRLKLNSKPNPRVSVNLAVDFFSFHGFVTSPLGTYGSADDTETSRVTINLDRAYVDLYFKHFDITIGKQRVAMGVSYLWAPLDVFNRINILEPKEEKPGTNAFKIYIPLGSSSALTGVFSPEDNFKSSNSGFRAKTQIFKTDIALSLIHQGDVDTTIIGLDLRGENIIGWWIEGGSFLSPEETDFKLVLGFDYTFPIDTGLYWMGEFFYDSSGGEESSQYDYDQLFSGTRFTLGRIYFLSMLRYGFSDFISLSISYIANWGDGSYIVNPAVQYEISQNISLSGGFYLPMGNSQGEFRSFELENEVQKIPFIFFIWLKINF
jgi:hypothetical protein